jgi:hypothetical protein
VEVVSLKDKVSSLCTTTTWSHNKSGFRGVCWDRTRGKWAVEIMIKKKHIHLGRFDDLIKAAKAYNKEAKKLFGPNAYQNEV